MPLSARIAGMNRVKIEADTAATVGLNAAIAAPAIAIVPPSGASADELRAAINPSSINPRPAALVASTIPVATAARAVAAALRAGFAMPLTTSRNAGENA